MYSYTRKHTLAGSIPVRGSYYGNSSAEILLDDILCDGSETSLLECSHAGLGVHNCDTQTELAGVKCEGKRLRTGAYAEHSEIALIVSNNASAAATFQVLRLWFD